jgi:hypothetical protein
MRKLGVLMFFLNAVVQFTEFQSSEKQNVIMLVRPAADS